MKLISLLIFYIFISSQLLYSQGFLHRNGRYIYDGEGNEVILRGIGTGNWMLQEGYMMQTSGIAGTQHEFREKLETIIGEEKTDSFYTVWLDSHFRKIDADSMKSWGFNSVRVAMHYKWFTPPIEDEPVPGEVTWIDKGFTMIDSLLSWCSDNEMYLILDLHGAPGGQGKDANISDYDDTKLSLWESDDNKSKTIALWRKLAERYSEEPWIGGYDLINETNWTFPEGNNSKLRELMVNITTAIREVDQNHIIFIEGNGFANDFSGLTPAWDDNMVYSFHKYWNYNSQESISFAINLRNSTNIPVWMGESGENSNVWFTSAIELFEKNKIGWSWWPVKKAGINNPLKASVNNDYTQLINYWKGTAAKPSVDAAFNAVLQFALNHRLENCTFQKDVVDAMLRQPGSYETIPYKLYHVGDTVFATDYNLGRSAFAYMDTDSANFRLSTGIDVVWNQGHSYRNDGVDIEGCTDTDASNGFNVGWTANGEWMEYTVVSDSTAAYKLSIRSASGSSGSKVHLEMDGIAISKLIKLPGTSGWQNWQTTISEGIILKEGINKIRFKFDQGGSNLNYFKFSDPVSVGNTAFQHLYASSSEDGKSIALILNKPLTSEPDDIVLTDFTVIRNNIPVTITSVTFSESISNTIIINLEEPLFYGATIKLSCQSDQIFSGLQSLEPFTEAEVVNRLPLRMNIPSKIQAEAFSYNNGFVSETCTDSEGGLDMGYAAPGDYLDYYIYVPQSRYYTMNTRVATTRASSQLVIRTGEDNVFTDTDTLVITSTGGWQAWKTLPLTFFLNEGRYTLRLYVRSGEFNINWFQLSYASTIGIENVEEDLLKIYPNPASDYVNIELSEENHDEIEISIYNTFGLVKKVKSVPAKGLRIDTSDLEKGVYFIMATKNGVKVSASKLLIL